MPPEVIENIRRIKDIGKAKYDSFVKLRIESQQDSFTSTLSQTNLKLFKDEMEKKKAAMSDKVLICDIKSQQAKVVDIMLAHQAGRIITEAVLSHESSEYPPSFTRKGLMHQTTKSDILGCIAPPVVCTRDAPATTCTILDGSVLVQQLRPETSITIKDYVDTVFGPHILRYFNNHQRVDVVSTPIAVRALKVEQGKREEKEKEGKWTAKLKYLETGRIFYGWAKTKRNFSRLSQRGFWNSWNSHRWGINTLNNIVTIYLLDILCELSITIEAVTLCACLFRARSLLQQWRGNVQVIQLASIYSHWHPAHKKKQTPVCSSTWLLQLPPVIPTYWWEPWIAISSV